MSDSPEHGTTVLNLIVSKYVYVFLCVLCKLSDLDTLVSIRKKNVTTIIMKRRVKFL